MLRYRRYRVYLVFAAIITILLVHMVRNAEWNESPKTNALDFKPPVPVKTEGPPQEGASGPENVVPDDTHKNEDGKLEKVETPAEHVKSTATRISTAVEQKVTDLGEKAESKVEAGIESDYDDDDDDEEVLGQIPKTPVATKTLAPSPAFESLPKVSLPDRKPLSTNDGKSDTSDVEDLHPVSPGRQSQPVFSAAPTTIHWERQKEHFPVPTESLILLPTGPPKAIPKIQYPFSDENPESQAKRVKRQELVKAEFKKAWKGYSTYAWLHDELKPVSGTFRDPFCGWSATLVDAMDTLWMMGLYEEFEAAVAALQQIDFTTSSRTDIPMFETTIRYLGGLIAAYDISGGKYKTILDKAVELADVLMGAFDTPNRMPVLYYNWKPAFASQPHRASPRSNLAELGSLSMEFTRLAQLTKEPRYYDAVARVTNALEEYQNRGTPLDGVFPESVDASGCNRTVIVSKPIGVSVNRTTTPTETVGYTPDEDDTEDRPATKESQKGDATTKQAEESIVPGEMAEEEAEIPNQKTEEKPQEPKEKKLAARQLEYGSSSNGETYSAANQDSKNKKVMKSPEPELQDTQNSQELDSSSENTKTSTENIVAQVEQKAKSKQPEAQLDDCVPMGLDSTNHGADKFSMGGSQDSTYEYFSKQYLLLGGLEEKYHTMYLKTLKAVRKWMIYRPMLPDNNDILFSGLISTGRNGSNPKLNPELTHLTCFLGGMVGMGAKVFGLEDDLEIAKKLTDGCVWAYDVTPTGIMPEFSTLIACEDRNECTWNETAYNLALDPMGESRDEQVQKYLENLEFRKEEEKRARIEAVKQAEKDLKEAKEALESAKGAVAAAEAAEAADEEEEEEGEGGEENRNDTKQESREDAEENVEKPKEPKEKKVTEEKKPEPRTEDDVRDSASVEKAKASDKTSSTTSDKSYAKRDMALEGTTQDYDDKDEVKGEGQRGNVDTQKKDTTKKDTAQVQIPPAEDVKPTPIDKTEQPTKTKSKGKEKNKQATLAPDPMRPLTHKEYVKQRIDQGLPPGFFAINDRRYILRPEAIESVWYMYRITGDPSWQDKGWQMFESIIASTKSEYGHSAIHDVTTLQSPVTKLDQMESFWLAETLKYFYLLYSTPDVVSLDEWVLNTEAHPFKRPT
ncbi:hypothetical protein B7463_g7950, partial [Scytalidium lignicola]